MNAGPELAAAGSQVDPSRSESRGFESRWVKSLNLLIWKNFFEPALAFKVRQAKNDQFFSDC